MLITNNQETYRKCLTLHAKQGEVFRDSHRFKVIVAGRRWGKSTYSGIEIIKSARLPNQYIWYVAPTYKMAKTIMWRRLLDWIPRQWIKKTNDTMTTILLVNNSLIELKGCDKKDNLRGVGLNKLILDEAQDIEEDTWYKVLRPTLADKMGEAVIIATPKRFNWLYDVYMLGQRGEYYQSGDKVRRNMWKSWQFPTITSPFVPESEIEQAKHDMDWKSFSQEFLANFESMSGRVYYAFERSTHIKMCKFNPDLPIWIGQDFNIDPMSSIIMQPQANGNVHVVDEIILPNSNVEEAAQEIQRRYWRYIDNITMYPDPSGGSRQHARGESSLQIMRENGLRVQKYRRKAPYITDRTNAVNRMFRAADGSVRAYVDPKCKHLIKGLEQLIYKEGTPDIDKSGGHDHACDAFGYAIEIEYSMRKVSTIGVSI